MSPSIPLTVHVSEYTDPNSGMASLAVILISINGSEINNNIIIVFEKMKANT